jgi:hypothetical protein
MTENKHIQVISVETWRNRYNEAQEEWDLQW